MLARSISLYSRKPLYRYYSKLGRNGDEYIVHSTAADELQTKGYTVLKGFLSEEELQAIEKVYTAFMRREIAVPGKDLCGKLLQ